MEKIMIALPTKPSERHVVLGLRENRLQWFTQKGWDLLSDRIEFGKQGQKIRVKKDGWQQVDPQDCQPAPSPLTAEQVKPAAPVDPKAVKTVEGGEPVKTEDISGEQLKGK